MPKQGRGKGNRKLPNVLLVDDIIEDADNRRLAFKRVANTAARTPSEVSELDLRWANVVLVDYKLTHWKRDDSLSLAERPENGVALAAVFRSHRLWESPIAFALHTGELKELAGPLKEDRHNHSIARINNVEWVFSKLPEENQQPFPKQVVALAEAILRLPEVWPTNNGKRMRTVVDKLLALGKQPWKPQAWARLSECHPPIHDLSPPYYAITFVRWLLTSILPYPTFLLDYCHVAARLRVTPASFKIALERDRKFAAFMNPCRYRGILSEFLGLRWWGAGIEDFLWKRTRGRSFDGEALRVETRKLSRYLRAIDSTEPVVLLDEEFRATGELAELTDAVELNPEDWPSFAGRPWMKRTVVEKSERLQSLAARSFERSR